MNISRQSLGRIGAPLADSLAVLEVQSSTLDHPAVREAILQTWNRLADDVASGTVDLSGEYLAHLHGQLATLAGGVAPGLFIDRGHLLQQNGQGVSWASFVEEVTTEEQIEPAWVLAQLRWGKHVCSLALSLSWLAMNIALITKNGEAIVPPITDHQRLLQYLDDAGPDLDDAESLRALIGTYIAEQRTRQ